MTTPKIDPETVADMLDGVKLVMSDAGYGLIYIAPVENEASAVAVPVRHKNMVWRKANPEVYEEMVRRFNGYHALAARVAELEASLGLVTAGRDAHAAHARLAEAKLSEAEAASEGALMIIATERAEVLALRRHLAAKKAQVEKLREALADAAGALDSAGEELSDFANILSRDPWQANYSYESAVQARAALQETEK